MFKPATLGIIGLMEEIIPVLTEHLKHELENRRSVYRELYRLR